MTQLNRRVVARADALPTEPPVDATIAPVGYSLSPVPVSTVSVPLTPPTRARSTPAEQGKTAPPKAKGERIVYTPLPERQHRVILVQESRPQTSRDPQVIARKARKKAAKQERKREAAEQRRKHYLRTLENGVEREIGTRKVKAPFIKQTKTKSEWDSHSSPGGMATFEDGKIYYEEPRVFAQCVKYSIRIAPSTLRVLIDNTTRRKYGESVYWYEESSITAFLKRNIGTDFIARKEKMEREKRNQFSEFGKQPDSIFA